MNQGVSKWRTLNNASKNVGAGGMGAHLGLTGQQVQVGVRGVQAVGRQLQRSQAVPQRRQPLRRARAAPRATCSNTKSISLNSILI